MMKTNHKITNTVLFMNTSVPGNIFLRLIRKMFSRGKLEQEGKYSGYKLSKQLTHPQIQLNKFSILSSCWKNIDQFFVHVAFSHMNMYVSLASQKRK